MLTWNCLKSQTFRRPSSPPDKINGSVRFQLITLTSEEWASLAESIELGGALKSQMRMDWSTEHDAKTWGWERNAHLDITSINQYPLISSHSVDEHTVASVGDHCRSSTDLLCELKGRWSIFQVPPSCGSQTWMFFLQSPLTRRPKVGKHSIIWILAVPLVASLDIHLYRDKTLFCLSYTLCSKVLCKWHISGISVQ